MEEQPYQPHGVSPQQQWQQDTLPHEVYSPPVPLKKQNKSRLFVIGCGSLLSIVVLVLLCSIISSLGKQLTTLAPILTATPTQGKVVAISTVKSTKVPTHVTTTFPTKVPTQNLAPVATIPPTAVLQPTQKPAPPKPTKVACVAVHNNPWCYNFDAGNLIYTPPDAFCNYFNCIATFTASDDPGDGYIIQCRDGLFSQSGGESGACSHHGGELKPLYSH